MKMRIALAVIAVLGLLASCAHIEPHPMDMTNAIRNAKTSADYRSFGQALRRRGEKHAGKGGSAKENARGIPGAWLLLWQENRRPDRTFPGFRGVYQEAGDANMNMAHYYRRLAEDTRQ